LIGIAIATAAVLAVAVAGGCGEFGDKPDEGSSEDGGATRGASPTSAPPSPTPPSPPGDPSPTATAITPDRSPSAIPRDEDGDAAVLEEVTWEDGEEGAPVLVFDPPIGVTGAAARLIAEGDGAEIAEGDTVTFDYAMFAGDSGEQAFTTYGTGRPQKIVVARSGMSQTFADALIGHRVGAKIVFATIDTSGAVPSDYAVTQFMAVTVVGAGHVGQRAEGTPVEPVEGLPAVTLSDSGEPSVAIPEAAPPGNLVSQYLIEGDGPKLASDQSAIVQFSGWVWDGATLFDSTWSSGAPMTWRLSSDAVIPGLAHGLVGKRVGSQVLLIVPPNLGLGDAAEGAIPAGSTLVYVVDILDVG
jgi:peptidylprolyl isomerase